jgi:hypothetical protein
VVTELRSKEPSCTCVTGMFSGASSAERTAVKELSPATIVDSGMWKAGLRAGIMEGVRTKTEGFGDGDELCRCGCASGREVRSGRKVWIVRIGVRRRVSRRSFKVDGERVAIGEDGYVRVGMRIKERNARW